MNDAALNQQRVIGRKRKSKSTPVVHNNAGADRQALHPTLVVNAKAGHRAKRAVPARSAANVAATTSVANVVPTAAAVPVVAVAAVAVVQVQVVVAVNAGGNGTGNAVENGDVGVERKALQGAPVAVPAAAAALAERRRALEAELADVRAAQAAQAVADAQKQKNNNEMNNNAPTQHAGVAEPGALENRKRLLVVSLRPQLMPPCKRSETMTLVTKT
jgi:hypothetical protein